METFFRIYENIAEFFLEWEFLKSCTEKSEHVFCDE